MTLDRNKTQLTHDVTEAAEAWLDAKGFKPTETEVPIEMGWVADIAGVIVPTMTELIELKLLPRKPNQFWKLPQERAANAARAIGSRAITCGSQATESAASAVNAPSREIRHGGNDSLSKPTRRVAMFNEDNLKKSQQNAY